MDIEIGVRLAEVLEPEFNAPGSLRPGAGIRKGKGLRWPQLDRMRSLRCSRDVEENEREYDTRNQDTHRMQAFQAEEQCFPHVSIASSMHKCPRCPGRTLRRHP